MQSIHKIGVVTTIIAAIAIVYLTQAFASHTFEAGTPNTFYRHTQGGSPLIPDNTHIRLDGIKLGPGDSMPLYDASPNYVSGHILLKAPCEPVEGDDDTYRPTVTLIAGHIDEHMHNTYVDKVPLYYIVHASNPPNSCVWHAHIPDPVNGGAPRVTDIVLINLSEVPIEFNNGDVVDINISNILGKIGTYYQDQGLMQLPGDLEHGNPVYDLNDDDDSNDGLGHIGGE